MRCVNCQAVIDERSRFCDHCGAPVPKAERAEQALYPQPSPVQTTTPLDSNVQTPETPGGPDVKPLDREAMIQYAVQDSELWALMFALAGENPDQQLVPLLKPEGAMYKVGEIDVPAERLRRLENQEGILDSVGQVSFAACPKCTSLNLAILLKCPKCGKQTLSKSEMLIHYECGHLTPIHEIIQPGRTVYTCPKCGKLMKRVGIDYGRPGLAFTCPDCKEVSQYPLVKLLCLNSHELKLDETELKQFSVYKLGKGMSTIPRIITVLNEIKTKLANSGHQSIILANVIGDSGNKYVTPLLVPTIPPLIADFILDRSTWEFQVIGAIRKTADLNARSLLVVQTEFRKQVDNMVNPEKIHVVEFETEDEIVEKVTKTIDDILSLKSKLLQKKRLP